MPFDDSKDGFSNLNYSFNFFKNPPNVSSLEAYNSTNFLVQTKQF